MNGSKSTDVEAYKTHWIIKDSIYLPFSHSLLKRYEKSQYIYELVKDSDKKSSRIISGLVIVFYW